MLKIKDSKFLIFFFFIFLADQKLYMLTNKDKYTVGRSAGDLILNGDASISREHAIIHVTPHEIQIEDKGSKYGVYLNKDCQTNNKMPLNQPKQLQIGEIVRFGQLQNIWRLEQIIINCCTSTLDKDLLPVLKAQLKIINGKLMNNWDETCTHLVMPNVTVTVKVLQSLAHGIPIVKPNYWDTYIQYATENRPNLANVNKFVPDISEPFIMKESTLMHVNLDRQRLFTGKTFVFMVRQHMLNFESIIKLANGTCVSLDKNPLRKSTLLNKSHIAVQYVPSTQSQCSQDISGITDYIIKNDRRIINESEIGLAIIHCSIDRFCNPERKLQSVFQVESIDSAAINGNVLVEETPYSAEYSVRTPLSSIAIPESIDLSSEEISNNDGNQQMDIGIDRSVSPIAPAPQLKPEEIIPIARCTSPKPSTSTTDLKRKTSNQTDVTNAPNKKQKINEIQPSTQSSSVSNLSGFLTTQNRFKKARTNVDEESPSLSQNLRSTMRPGEGRKRVLQMLNADSDDDDDDAVNIYQFGKNSIAKKPRRANESENLRKDSANDDDENGGNLFNFSNKRPNKDRSTESSGAETGTEHINVAMPYQRPINNATSLKLSNITPIKLTADGWLSRSFKKDLNIADGENVSVITPSVRIKEEKLEDWEMTDEEKKQKWIKSIKNAFEVRKFDANIVRQSHVDVTDHSCASSTLNGTKNFKAFVKV